MNAGAKRCRGFTPNGEMEYSKLLIDEAPLQVLPSLAVLIGLNEAIVLQQLHYWIGKSENEYEARLWVYNTYEQWQAQFFFWSVATVQRTFTSLEKQGVVLSRRFEVQDWNQRKWYTIDYAALNKLAQDKAA
jgi:hypothetical protein